MTCLQINDDKYILRPHIINVSVSLDFVSLIPTPDNTLPKIKRYKIKYLLLTLFPSFILKYYKNFLLVFFQQLEPKHFFFFFLGLTDPQSPVQAG